MLHWKNSDASFTPHSRLHHKRTLTSSKNVTWLCSHLDGVKVTTAYVSTYFFHFLGCFRIFFKDFDDSEEESLVEDLWRRLHFFAFFLLSLFLVWCKATCCPSQTRNGRRNLHFTSEARHFSASLLNANATMWNQKSKTSGTHSTKPNVLCADGVVAKAPKQSTRFISEIDMESMIDLWNSQWVIPKMRGFYANEQASAILTRKSGKQGDSWWTASEWDSSAGPLRRWTFWR